MADVSISVSEVKDKTKPNPWDKRDDFVKEIKPEEMADHATSFVKASGEAESAMQLGKLATDHSEDSGSQDGTPLLDAEERDNLTDKALGNSGDSMDAVVKNVYKAIGLATDASEETTAEIEGGKGQGKGLEQRIKDLSDSAEADYDAAKYALSNFRPSGSGLPDRGFSILEQAEQPPPTYIYKEVEYTAVSDGRGGWAPPGGLATAIKQHYLGEAVKAAKNTHGEIKDIIQQYRKNLSELGLELEEAGYDTSDGPLKLWHTDEMAAYNGKMLEQELSKKNPDADALDQYTVGLGSAIEDMYDKNGDPDFKENKSNLDEYVNNILKPLSAESLATLGNMDTSPSSPRDSILGAKQAVANGINAAMNPEVGGIDYSSRDAHRVIPDSISGLISHHIKNKEDLQEFNALGSLMGNSTVAAGDAFSKQMAQVAIDSQQSVETLNLNNANAANGEDEQLPKPLSNTGSSGFLNAVAHNSDVSVSLLNEKNTREDLLNAHWADSKGISEIVKSAIDPGEDGELSKNQMLAADHVVKHFANSPQLLVEDWSAAHEQMYKNIHPMDSSDLQESVATAALNRLDILSNTTNHHYSSAERAGTFQLMGALDHEANRLFQAGVYEYQRNTAHDVFTGNAPSSGSFRKIGDLQGLTDWGERAAIHHYEGREDKQEKLRTDIMKSSIIAGATMGGLAPAAGPIFTTGGAVSLVGGSLVNSMPDAPIVDSREQMEDALADNASMRHAIASAALQVENDPEESFDGKYQSPGREFELPTLGSNYSSVTGEGGSLVDVTDDMHDKFNYSSDYDNSYGNWLAFNGVDADVPVTDVQDKAGNPGKNDEDEDDE
ncbi:hypothetical protein [Streptomyces oceani]|uniref:hypothetical protein n=1 Tax=Streptomyces oceani TaxID=1075402 RepID=UPI001112D7D3|nr:hypothetical protein [Streptomyces oceani]